MKITELFQRDEAVSPVIGVILMVAITVIMAAVVGGFLLGIDSGETAPQTTWEIDQYTDDNGNVVAVEITATSGSPVDPTRTNLSYSGDFDIEKRMQKGNVTVLYPGNTKPTAYWTGMAVDTGGTAATSDTIKAGDSVMICFVQYPPPVGWDFKDPDAAGETLRVYWTPEGSSNSKTLGTTKLDGPIDGNEDTATEYCNYNP